jgi:hypothetical protein
MAKNGVFAVLNVDLGVKKAALKLVMCEKKPTFAY